KMEAMEERIKSLEAQVKQQNANSGKPGAAADITGTTKPDKSKPDKSQADKSQPDKSQADKSQAEKSKTAGDQSATPGAAASDQAAATKPDKAANLDKAVAESTDKPILGLMESPGTGLSIAADAHRLFCDRA